MFVDFRDKLLLTNKAGIKINDFYYKYTLYPAEAFKSLDQKLLKTLTLDQIRDKKLANKLESNLAAYNYLNISESNAADLSLINKADKLFLNRGSKTLVETNLEEFLARPKTALKIFSKKSDSNLFFRRFTFVSLIIGLPLFIYLFFHSCINYISTRFLSINASNIIASVFCLIIGLMLLLPFHLSRQKHYEVETANELILSDNWQERMEGLKIIYEKGLSIDDYPSYNKSIVSPYIPERYWLAMALGNGTGEGGVKDLLTLLDDPHPNVACKAYYSIAKRKNTVMIPLLKEKLNKSEN